MKKAILTTLQYIFFALLAVFFVWLSIRGLDHEKWEQLKKAMDKARYWLLIPVFSLLLLSHWIRALRWRQLMEPMGYHPARLNAFFAVMIGYFVNLGAPRLGEVVKCTILARYEKVPAQKLVGTIVAERAFDVICLLLVFGLTFVFQFNTVSALVHSYVYPAFQNKNGQTAYHKIVIVAISLIVFFILLKILFSRFGHINLIQKLRNILTGVWHGLISVRALKNKPLFFAYTFIIWFLYLLSTWCGFFAIDETSRLTLADALTVLAMGSVGMILSPGGIGAYALLVMETVALYNIPKEPYGQALGWLLWFGQFLSFVIFGVVSFILLPRVNRNNHKPDETPAGYPA
ncbi:MAG: lysylphosphatidylglycerol synthase transmembrane domain-containing protein [Bacteroidota bacterium]|nr:lysylphosphatidylglycerol synthase transmembrane domain-containing protein [Bacteroidota bacterium]MDP4211126.1 lysylphosphatidylglycerol synthase transmembrane domain-containing protein [Bacteroidota bacterium]MDP4249139.1 lysylphosphatidylglycerol synthase transmembrane domain-containing protein [Bacteroidota bacterium]